MYGKKEEEEGKTVVHSYGGMRRTAKLTEEETLVTKRSKSVSLAILGGCVCV